MSKYIANMECGTGHTSYAEPIEDTDKERIMRQIRESAEDETPAGESAIVRVAEFDEDGARVDQGRWESRWDGKAWTEWEYRD